MGDFGNVSSLSSSSEDITSEYIDTETRLKALNIRKNHLLELLEKLDQLKDLFEIEKELGDVTYEIESLKGTLQKYDSLVDLATIAVEIEEVSEIHKQKKVRTFRDEIRRMLVSLVPLGLVIYCIISLVVMIILNVLRDFKLFKKRGKLSYNFKTDNSWFF